MYSELEINFINTIIGKSKDRHASIISQWVFGGVAIITPSILLLLIR